MKKIVIGNNQVYWYNTKIGMLFYDYRMNRQVATSMFNKTEYKQFKTQIK